MACTHCITVDGYDFIVITGCGAEDGVVVNDTSELDDIEYIMALKKMIYLYRFVEAADKMEHYAYCYRGYWHRETEAILQAAMQILLSPDCPDEIRNIGNSYIIDYHASLLERKSNKKKQPRKKKPGYVYVLKGPKGQYKIGKTVNYKSRGKTFGIQLPFEVEFDIVISSDDYDKLEDDLHMQFDDKRTNGEWFTLDGTDLDWIRKAYLDALVDITASKEEKNNG